MGDRWVVYVGSCLDVLAEMKPESVDSIVTDPPYHLTSIVKRFGKAGSAPVDPKAGVFARKAKGFMGQEWDGGDVAFRVETWEAALRVLKPGGHLLAFGGTRTYHRMVCAIEDAGFEIRDQIDWLYGSGFPKSLNVSRGIDKETEGDWEGWGTALKPAHEPICLARKPLAESSIVRQVLATGTGAINVDGCRSDRSDRSSYGLDGDEPSAQTQGIYGKFGKRLAFNVTRSGEASASRVYADEPGDFSMKPGPRGGDPLGRWPANVLHDGSDEVVGMFPQDGTTSAARFCYCAKASRDDREEGLHELEESELHRVNPGGLENDPRWAPVKRRNVHATVKPTALMRWLVRLVTPPGGILLDPFTGSGSTGKAAMLEGFRFVGVELLEKHAAIARKRIEWAAKQPLEREAELAQLDGQGTLFGGSGE